MYPLMCVQGKMVILSPYSALIYEAQILSSAIQNNVTNHWSLSKSVFGKIVWRRIWWSASIWSQTLVSLS